MNTEINFKISLIRKTLGIIYLLLMIGFSIWFIVDPELFLRNYFSRPQKIVLLGVIGIVFFLALMYSFIHLFNRKIALIISEEFFKDYSKYESLGKIYWCEVLRIQKINSLSLEITLKQSVFKRVNLSLLKKFLLFMQNWNYRKSIIISSVLLECSIDDLEKMLSNAFKNYNKKNNIVR